VVDIGGGIGDYTILAALVSPRNRVIAFEPTPSSFELLQHNLRLNGITNATALQQGIWSHAGDLEIDTSSGEPVQFTSRLADQKAGPGKTVVPAVTLAQALDANGINEVDLLKMDCEGAEYPILYNTPAEALGRIRRIVMEYHDGPHGQTHLELERFLIERGYRVRSVVNPVHANLGYLYAARP
jgi:FkbM family methyltransferase